MKWKKINKTAWESGKFVIEKFNGKYWPYFGYQRICDPLKTLKAAKAECLYHKDPNPITLINTVVTK